MAVPLSAAELERERIAGGRYYVYNNNRHKWERGEHVVRVRERGGLFKAHKGGRSSHRWTG